MRGVHVETVRLEEPMDSSSDLEVMYLCLDGEVVLDFGLEFAHLRPFESFTVRGAHRLSPVKTTVLLRVQGTG